MPSPAFDPSSVPIDGDMTLILGRRTTRIAGHRVKMHVDVANELRSMCDATLSYLRDRQQVRYSDDLNFNSETHYMVANTSKLVAHIPESRRGRHAADEQEGARTVEVDAATYEVLSNASSQPLIGSDEIERRKSFLFSAVVVGDDPDNRVAFVSAYNPYRAAERGRLVTSFGDGLRRVTGPLLGFQPLFDMVVTAGHVAILRAEAFEKVFRDIDSMKERIPAWTAAVTAAFPFSKATADRIAAMCETSPRLARQVRSLFERGVPAENFTIPALRQQLTEEGFDPDRIIKNGKLVISDDEIPDFLKLLDERFVTGWLSGTHWDVGTRSPRQG